MKVCFLLQRSFAQIGHSLAVNLKERHGFDQFCGYVHTRPSYEFLTKQTDIKYTQLLLDEDIHKKYKQEKLDYPYLKKIEQEYGVPNLWPYIALDRVLMFNQLVREYPYDQPSYTHEEMLRIFQVKAKAIIEMLEKEKPDAVIFSAIGAVGSLLLYHVARKRGIKTWVILPTTTRDRYTLSEAYDHFTEVEKKLAQGKTSAENKTKAEEFIAEFRKKPLIYNEVIDPKKQPVNRRKQMKFILPSNAFRTLKWLTKYFYRHYTTKDRFDYSYIGPWNYLKDTSKRKLRNLIGTNNLYDKFDPDEDFAFFPLHFEPEIALLLSAPFSTNQKEVIKNIARSLPVGQKLYVKEHPQMVIFRPRSYYKEIKKIPNVKLIPPSITSFEIIARAKLIATITGTVGWESCFLKKPVITFGDVFYNCLSFVKNCKTMEELPYLVKEQLENFKYDDNEFTNLVAALFEESADVALPYLWDVEKDMGKKKLGLVDLADLLAKKLTP